MWPTPEKGPHRLKTGRVITVLDRGSSSKDNLKELQKAGGHYIVGDRMRSGQAEVNEAMKRPERYHEIRENLRTKEIVVGDGEARYRYVLVHNPSEAKRQKAKREEMIKNLKAQLAQIKDLPENQHTKAVCTLVAMHLFPFHLREYQLSIDQGLIVSDKIAYPLLYRPIVAPSQADKHPLPGHPSLPIALH